MLISITCPNCGTKGKVTETSCGKKARCKKCQHYFLIHNNVETGVYQIQESKASEVSKPAIIPQYNSVEKLPTVEQYIQSVIQEAINRQAGKVPVAIPPSDVTSHPVKDKEAVVATDNESNHGPDTQGLSWRELRILTIWCIAWIASNTLVYNMSERLVFIDTHKNNTIISAIHALFTLISVGGLLFASLLYGCSTNDGLKFGAFVFIALTNILCLYIPFYNTTQFFIVNSHVSAIDYYCDGYFLGSVGPGNRMNIGFALGHHTVLAVEKNMNSQKIIDKRNIYLTSSKAYIYNVLGKATFVIGQSVYGDARPGNYAFETETSDILIKADVDKMFYVPPKEIRVLQGTKHASVSYVYKK